MKKHLLGMAVVASMTCSVNAIADDKEIDMSNPTDVYTSVGVSYGTDGANLKTQLMLSEKTDTSGQKSGIIFEAKNIFNEGDKSAQFSGMNFIKPEFKHETSKRSFRMRYGTVNTTNGTGWSIDAIMADHPFFGKMGVVQAGPVMTIPVTDNFYIWPILYAGGVITENNTNMLLGNDLTGPMVNLSSGGVDVASMIMTGMVYARYSFNDNWWALVSASYTDEIQGKSWSANVEDGGLQMAGFLSEATVAYQINNRQNIRVNYKTDNSDDTDDSYWVEYNYAF